MITVEENASMEITVDDEGQLLASACGNMLPVDRFNNSTIHFISTIDRIKAYIFNEPNNTNVKAH